MIRIVTRALGLLASLSLAAFIWTARVLAAPNDVHNTENVVAPFATTWNHRDLDAFGKLFAPDAGFVNVACKTRRDSAASRACTWRHAAEFSH